VLPRLLHAPREVLGVRNDVVIEEKLVRFADAARLLRIGTVKKG
jgi:hypothetical protein